jgi:dipeptidyl aminopeptidase/acylaminoacyl peptidase
MPAILRYPLAALAVLVVVPSVASGQKPAVTPADYGKWESLGAAALSPNGQWLAYAINRVNEENELRMRSVARDSTTVVKYATGAVFSPDSRWLAYSIGVSPAERARLERDKKPIRTSVGIRNVATGAETVVAEVASFRFSGDGRFIAMRGYPAEGKRTANLFVQDLAAGTRLTFGNVGAFSWSEPGALLALTIETETGVGNAIQVYDATRGSLKVLESSASMYRTPVWRAKATDLAVLRTRVDRGFRDTAHVVLAFTGVALDKPARRELDPATAGGFPQAMRVAEYRTPEWSKDGSTILIGLRERERAASRSDSTAKPDSATNGAGRDTARAKGEPEKPSDVQIWHARDVRIMPQQKAQEQQDLQRTLPATWRLPESRVVQLGDDPLEPPRLLEGGRFAVETDATPYPTGTMFGRDYQDVWVTDTKTGARRKVLDKVRFFYGGSATGNKLLAYDGKDYIAVDVATGARVNLTAKVQGNFSDVDYDYPSDLTPPSGVAGWTKDDRAVLVYDQYDVWSLAPDGSGGKRLTDGAREGIVHRYVRTPRDVDGIDPSKPMYFSISGKRSKKSGYARLMPGKAIERLVLEDARVTRLQRADSTEVVAFTRERFDDSPDWFVGGADLASAKQMSTTNPFQKDYAWGRSEIVDFKSAKGRDLQGALFYPANYDASKKYPMIVYTYELLSQNVHNYVVPSERSYYNFSVFTANGYLVFTPDIVFTGREPGVSVLESVEPGVRAVVARGLADSARVGIVGHSWGGYEATFLPTRTNIFAASVAGAPITNFLSFAGAIHWTPGIPEFSHWETGQARMDVPPWEDVEAYLRNSPIAKVQDLKTPMLMEVGDADGTVDWHQGIEFYNFARRAGISDFVLLVYPGEDHGLRKKENQIDYHRRILQWFGHYLKGDPAPKWMKEGMTWMDRKALLAPPR